MTFPNLGTASKSHWRHTDSFGTTENEYIKSFIHRDYSIGFHTHSFYELNVVMGGEGYHYIGDMACAAKVGSVFLIPPRIPHGYVNVRGLDVYHMLIHKKFIDRCFGEFKETEGYALLFEIEPYLRARYDENMFLILSEKELRHVKKDIDTIEACKKLADANIFINSIAKNILCRLCLLMLQSYDIAEEPLRPNKELAEVADCLNFIHQNYADKLTIEFLARRMHISRSTLIRQFTKICGCSPHQYIRDYRLKKAKEYLKHGKKSLDCIAQECGFYDASHLRKALQKSAEYDTIQ